MTDRRVRIVVGFDGSPTSLLALNWALTEARLRDGIVMLCHVSPGRRASGDFPDTPDSPGDSPGDSSDAPGDERMATAQRVLARGVRHASRQAPAVRVIPELLFGGPAHQLLSAASGAALLVVGARGEDGFPGLRLGSVSAQVARHATCTVIVVPGLVDRAGNQRHRQIVVGVDGSTGSRAALAFAFAEAADRQAEVRAVYVFDAATLQTMASLQRKDLLRLHVRAADTLHGLVTAQAEHDPDIEICCEVLSGAPATTLTAAAAGAELLVLGSRGHGDIAALMLGSTSHNVLHNATCPVAVIRGDPHADPTGSRHRVRVRDRGSLVRGGS
ncbi:MAG: hypothetical protein GEV28_00250 [Actinophytocola sp.]|uniref:universal stress protein n=1 Tax=Actinophytocola sp. TaxID=1872138 RepID=UPI001329FCFF|nr:universal stress protein [Actinophytocola sp.]MPZ78902.1 hypothetical protein [Actinophytocola sp.]